MPLEHSLNLFSSNASGNTISPTLYNVVAKLLLIISETCSFVDIFVIDITFALSHLHFSVVAELLRASAGISSSMSFPSTFFHAVNAPSDGHVKGMCGMYFAPLRFAP